MIPIRYRFTPKGQGALHGSDHKILAANDDPLCNELSRKLGLANEPLFQVILQRAVLTALRVCRHTSMEANRMGIQLIEHVRERAYQLWEADGCQHSRDMEYWFRAEAQVASEQAAKQVQTQPSQAILALTPGTVVSSETTVKPKKRGKTVAESGMAVETAATATSASRQVRSRKA